MSKSNELRLATERALARYGPNETYLSMECAMTTETASTITDGQKQQIVCAICALAAAGALPEQIELTRVALVKGIAALNSSPLA